MHQTHGTEEFNVLFLSPLTVSRTFHSLFRVLCNFPSRYLFAIGLAFYLAFGETYLHFELQFQITLLSRLDQWSNLSTITGLLPSLIMYSNRITVQKFNQVTIRNQTPWNFKFHFIDELLRVHSPLLTESQLFSFPSLNDMLKFRELSRPVQVVYSKGVKPYSELTTISL